MKSEIEAIRKESIRLKQ